MREPAVAVIIRTKNRPLLLERAIKSVLAQSYGDFMIIVVNDGGDSGPIDALLKKYSKQINSRVKVVNNKKSVGAGEACNVGIRNSESMYITMHDDDDTWHPDFLETAVQYLELSGDMGVVTGSEIIEESIHGSNISTIRRQRFAPHITSINLFSLVGINQFPIHSFVYRRQAIKKVGLYDADAHPIEDWDFNIRFLRHYDIHYINKPLVYYHQRVDGEGAFKNSMSDGGHRNSTTRMLNKFLREDLDNKTLGLGLIANISNQLHESRMDIKRDQIHQTLILNSIQESLKEYGLKLDRLNEEVHLLSHMGARIVGYAKRAPRKVASKVTGRASGKS